MAKPSPSRDSRERVFSAATLEFAERGYEAAGVDRIAAKARINKAMIYYHFGSKQDLYVEVLRDMFQAVGTRARAIADGSHPAERKIDLWIATIVDQASQRPWFPPIMLRELASGFIHIDAETVALLNTIFVAVCDMIAQGQQDGVFRDVDPLLTHLTIMPAVLVYFARERALTHPPKAFPHGQPLAAAKSREEFVHHMQQAVRGMLRKE